MQPGAAGAGVVRQEPARVQRHHWSHEGVAGAKRRRGRSRRGTLGRLGWPLLLPPRWGHALHHHQPAATTTFVSLPRRALDVALQVEDNMGALQVIPKLTEEVVATIEAILAQP